LRAYTSSSSSRGEYPDPTIQNREKKLQQERKYKLRIKESFAKRHARLGCSNLCNAISMGFSEAQIHSRPTL